MMWRRADRGAQPGRAATPPAAGGTFPRPIVVGVDGSAASTRALEWATIRALAGHTSLRIVHVVQARLGWLDPTGFFPCWDVESRDLAEQVLLGAVEVARCQAPQVRISTRLRGVDPAGALLDEGRSAELIVLGRSHWQRGPRWLPVSVTARVVRGARGRVVLVGPDNELLV
jgi:nucleotide-binding universal stress UspA family protein